MPVVLIGIHDKEKGSSLHVSRGTVMTTGLWSVQSNQSERNPKKKRVKATTEMRKAPKSLPIEDSRSVQRTASQIA